MSRVEVKYEDLEMGECIGKGFFGEVRRRHLIGLLAHQPLLTLMMRWFVVCCCCAPQVRRARWQGTDVAVKVIYRKSFRSADEFQLFEKEVAVLR
jgi:hypothetical protein